MQVTRYNDAKPYEAPGHFAMTALRLQGWDITNTANFWVGLSTFEPGGGAEKGSTPFEKVYVVIEGELTVITDEGETVLGPFDTRARRIGRDRQKIETSIHYLNEQDHGSNGSPVFLVACRCHMLTHRRDNIGLRTIIVD